MELLFSYIYILCTGVPQLVWLPPWVRVLLFLARCISHTSVMSSLIVVPLSNCKTK